MYYKYYYDRTSQCWWGFWTDIQGNQLGEAIHAFKKENLLVELGTIKEDRRALITEEN